MISRLKGQAFRIISYADRCSDWALGMRCRLLLAGASCVLDSGQEGFDQALKRWLVGVFQQETQRWNEQQEIKGIMKRLGIVGQSEAMVSVFRSVLRASTLSDLPTLITGESGTGKELLARAIHQLDPKRRGGPFVAINCAAISPGLAETDLFGHRKGAFTGADRDRKGLIRSAHGGVLFLDEIGEMNADLQAKLLRVLQEKHVLGVGHDQEVSVDFRVVAATNRSLDQLVPENKFRADLLHRLNVLSIHIRPLRDRTEDLKPLIEHFLAKYHSLVSVRTVSVGPEFIEALAQSGLPGNARQLENLVRRALVNKADDIPLCLSDLPIEILQQLCARGDGGPIRPEPSCRIQEVPSVSLQTPSIEFLSHMVTLMQNKGWGLATSLQYYERLLLEAALQHAHGNQSRAAHLLRITPRSVYNKLLKHHIGH